MPEAICIGLANIDLLASVVRFPSDDDEVKINSLKILHGGSAANVAVGISRLGHSSGLIGIMGDDYFGKELLNELRKEKVDTKYVKQENGSSGLVFAAVTNDGKRRLFTCNEAASKFNKSHVAADYIKNSKILHITSIIGEDVLEAFEYASIVAKQNNVRVIFDPGSLLAIHGAEKLKNILKNCFAVLPNEVEIEMLTGMNGEEGARKLLEYRVENVVLKLGGKGAILVNKQGIRHFDSKKININPTKDTTGAGDVFAAGFISGILEGKGIEEAIDLGLITSSVSTNYPGARTCPTREEAKKYL